MTAKEEEDMKPITPCLWFDGQGEEAAEFYIGLFPDSRITHIARYTAAGPGPEGTAMTVSFELNGRQFLALNGGPQYRYSEAISFQVFCDSQDEVDRYWTEFGAGGEEGPCGWIKDRFGLSWQVVPNRLVELLEDPDAERSARVMQAMMEMGKIEIAELERAAEATTVG
jgi:predicted 3-demethylubiquinone-9 3-methyltransferase (glyoxalase superfamily)